MAKSGGFAEENVPVTGNPSLIGGRYDSTSRSLDDGDAGAVALDSAGRLLSKDTLGRLTGSVDISLGCKYPGIFSYLLSGHKPRLLTGSRTAIQNDPAVTTLTPSLTPAVATFTSTDANDTAAGTGARTVSVLGVDGNGYFRTELVNLNGVSGANTVNTYYVIDNAVTVAEGAAGQQGRIDIDIAGNSQGAITADLKASLTAHFLAPVNYYFYGTQQVESATSNVKISSHLQFNVFGGGTTETVGNVFHASFTAHSLVFADAPFPLPPGTYARFDAEGNSGDGATVTYLGLMVHTDLVKDLRGHVLTAPAGTVYNTDSLTDTSIFCV